MVEHPNAHYIVDRVKSAANEFDLIAHDYRNSDSKRMLAATDQNACLAAAALIKELDRELFRVRTAAAMHLQGHMNRHDLCNIIQSWNDAENTPSPELVNSVPTRQK